MGWMTIGNVALATAGALALFAAGAAAAADDCVICAKSVVTNRDLAACFLERYGKAQPTGAAVAVDLTGCERGRSIVQALPSPAMALGRPDTRFLISRAQLDCLRRKLADPQLVLDPQARIELDSCG